MAQLSQYRHGDETAGAVRAAAQIVPVIVELVGPVHSVVDVGGGAGAWLKSFQEAGATRLELLDSPTVEPHLLIPRECFHPVDLERELPPPGRFDLAISVECAEHLSHRRAQPLVQWLTSAADVVVFSAAIPGQGGKHHVNEQAPRYWEVLFRKAGYVRRDVIRPKILTNASIPFWYRQNMLLYVKEGHPLASGEPDFLPDDFALIHRIVEERYGSGVLRATKHLTKEIFAALGWHDLLDRIRIAVRRSDQ